MIYVVTAGALAAIYGIARFIYLWRKYSKIEMQTGMKKEYWNTLERSAIIGIAGLGLIIGAVII
jgi:hypothetical protein